MSGLPDLHDARGTALRLRERAPVDPSVQAAAARILDAVARDGEAAALRYTAQFDGVKLDAAGLYAPRAVMERARQRTPQAELQRWCEASERGAALAESQKRALGPGRWIPAQQAALYLRRDLDLLATAALVGFARAAGVKRLIAATPPSESGTLPGASGAQPETLALAAELGLAQVALVGGAQAVALLARDCDLILGAAGPHGSEARRQLSAQLAWIPPEGPKLALVEGEGASELPHLEDHAVLALDDAAAARIAPGPHRYRANRDRAVVFAQALRPLQVSLFVKEPARWLGELTDARAVLVNTARAAVEVPVTALLRLQPVIGLD